MIKLPQESLERHLKKTCYRCKTETIPTAPRMSKTTYGLFVWVGMDDQVALECREAYQMRHSLALSSTRMMTDQHGGEEYSMVLSMEGKLLCDTTICHCEYCLSRRKGTEQG